MTTGSTTDPASVQLGSPDRPLRVLMADDDRNDHLMMLMAADTTDLEVEFTFVDDGLDLMFALARCGRVAELPDLIILDLRMPGLDGHRTLDELQTHPVLCRIPVVVFSSSSRAADRTGSYQRGALSYQTKPSSFSELAMFVRSLPGRCRQVDYDAIVLEELGGPDGLQRLAADIVAQLEDEFLVTHRADLLPDVTTPTVVRSGGAHTPIDRSTGDEVRRQDME